MLNIVINQFIAHLMTQNDSLNTKLRNFAGKKILFKIYPLTIGVHILEDGNLAIIQSAVPADLSIDCPPSLLLRLIRKDEKAFKKIRWEGDFHLLSIIWQVFRSVTWEIEEDLSHLTNDFIAHGIMKFMGNRRVNMSQQLKQAQALFFEYVQEESLLLTPTRNIKKFIQEVDTLKENTARLEQRLDHLKNKQTK